MHSGDLHYLPSHNHSIIYSRPLHHMFHVATRHPPTHPTRPTPRYFLGAGKEGQEKLKSKLDSDMDDYFKAAKGRGLKGQEEGKEGEEPVAAGEGEAEGEGDGEAAAAAAGDA